MVPVPQAARDTAESLRNAPNSVVSGGPRRRRETLKVLATVGGSTPTRGAPETIYIGLYHRTLVLYRAPERHCRRLTAISNFRNLTM